MTPLTPQQFKSARQRLGLSASGLARLLGLGANGGRTVRRWEAGDIPISGPAQLVLHILDTGTLPDLEPYRDLRRRPIS